MKRTFRVVGLSIAGFTPSRLLLVPTNGRKATFAPCTLTVLTTNYVVLFVMDILRRHNVGVERSLTKLDLPVAMTVCFYLLTSVKFFKSATMTEKFVCTRFWRDFGGIPNVNHIYNSSNDA